ncbi:ATPase P [Mycolicibacterium conceptionense]|uniref:ATPase P n=1 Tax=Mycolicibacterium conceptionense TaxID=451644 RepID=A0A0U1DKT7_9MYCO|nr:ATPase P [Mycolicibacterium conceptionense]
MNFATEKATVDVAGEVTPQELIELSKPRATQPNCPPPTQPRTMSRTIRLRSCAPG